MICRLPSFFIFFLLTVCAGRLVEKGWKRVKIYMALFSLLDKILWVRWKKSFSGAESDKTLLYKVMIK